MTSSPARPRPLLRKGRARRCRIGGDAEQAEGDDHDRATHHAHVGDVEHGPVRKLEKLDDCAAERSGFAQQPVMDVAERAAHDETERHGVPGRACTALTAKTMTPATMASWRQVTTGVISAPIPQAAPLLYSSVSWRISPMNGWGSSRGREATAQFFVIWSATAMTAPIAAMMLRTVRRLRRRAPDPGGPALADSDGSLFTDRSSPACPASRWRRAR